MPADDYPNVLNVSKDGMIMSYYDTPGGAGNMFPTTFPVRCQACGKNVLLPNGTKGDVPCAPKDEMWFKPNMHINNKTNKAMEDASTIAEHNNGLMKYSKDHNGSIPYWWVEGIDSIDSKCPRGIDCPDWRYEGEEDYSRQIKLLESISKVVDLSKVAIGFETLGIDVEVQMVSWQDKALPWSNITDKEKWSDDARFYRPLTKNLTTAAVKAGALEKEPLYRGAQPLLSQQWGLKMVAEDIVGLEAAVEKKTGKKLAGIGIFTTGAARRRGR